MNLNGGGSGREVFRYALPNIIAFSVTSTKSPAGFILQQRTKYDFSDRPQFIGSTCTGTGSSCGDVVVTYSTTPTARQTEPFDQKNGTLRWENLTRGTSHCFFEQAVGQSQDRADTLEVIRYDANTGAATTLVPYKQTFIAGTKTVEYSVVISRPYLAFRDTTFVRNSGRPLLLCLMVRSLHCRRRC